MFTGIVETLGVVSRITRKNSNLDIEIEAGFVRELKIDQSIAHNGACLTVTEIANETYTVTAITETLAKTNLNILKTGDQVNLERCVPATGRFDGHFVQGHVDQTGVCKQVSEMDGSWLFHFTFDPTSGNVTVEKGSVSVNGVSLTVVDSYEDGFSVAVIPYTFENTNFKFLTEGDEVNLEFDIIGKYIKRYLSKVR